MDSIEPESNSDVDDEYLNEDIPIEENNEEEESSPYIEDLKYFLSNKTSNISKGNQIFLNQLPSLLKGNLKKKEMQKDKNRTQDEVNLKRDSQTTDNMKSSSMKSQNKKKEDFNYVEFRRNFIDFFSEEFDKQLDEVNIITTLENSYFDENLSKIVPQISFIFKTPFLLKETDIQVFINDLDEKERLEKIIENRKNHNLYSEGKDGDLKNGFFKKIQNSGLYKKFLEKYNSYKKIKASKAIFEKMKNKNELLKKNMIGLGIDISNIEKYPSKIDEKLKTHPLKEEPNKNDIENHEIDNHQNNENLVKNETILNVTQQQKVSSNFKKHKEEIGTEMKIIIKKTETPQYNSLRFINQIDFSSSVVPTIENIYFSHRSEDIKNNYFTVEANQPLLSEADYEKNYNFTEVQNEKLNLSNSVQDFDHDHEEENVEDRVREERQRIEKMGNFFENLELSEKNRFLYMDQEEISIDHIKNFLIEFFDKLDETKSIIFKESILKRFVNNPDNFLNIPKSQNQTVNLFFCMITIFTATINYFTGLKFKFFLDEADFFNIDFYLDEKGLCQEAKRLNYKLQYRIISELNNQNSITKNKAVEKTKLIELNTRKYSNLDDNDISNFPPFLTYTGQEEKRNYYRRYDNKKSDQYHLCEECYFLKKKTYEPKCDSSNFRHIDKQRVVFQLLNGICDMTNKLDLILTKEKKINFLMEILFIHNYNAYGNEFDTKNVIQPCISILESKDLIDLNNNVRKMIGEDFGFYYVWISHYIKLITIPAFVGTLIFLVLNILRWVYGEKRTSEMKLDLYLLLPFSCFIIIWSKIYCESWNLKEKFYKFKWGMNEVFNDEIVQKKKISRFLDIIIPQVDNGKILMRKLVSWAITSVFFIIVILINIFVFWLQFKNIQSNKGNNLSIVSSASIQLLKNNTIYNTTADQINSLSLNQEYDYNLFWLYVVPVFMFFIREIMTEFYYTVSHYLTNYEQNTKFSEKRTSFILKASFFQFFNYYFNLYYIAFFKRSFESCVYGNCKEELSNQLTIILFTALLNDLIGLILNLFNYHTQKQIDQIKDNLINLKGVLKEYKKKKFKEITLKEETSSKNNKKNENLHKHHNVNGSIKQNLYDREIYDERNADKEYVQIIMNYGYIIQFGTSSPICFLFALLQAMIARINDLINMTQYSHVNLIDGSVGIGSHIQVISFLTIIGLMTNITINLFVDDRVLDLKPAYRWVILFSIQNFLMIVVSFMKFNYLPKWFEYKNRSKFSYVKYLGENKGMVSKNNIP